MESTYQSLVNRVLAKWDELNAASHTDTSSSPSRLLIALAGAPGSGKTTIALQVLKRINALAEHPKTNVISADGFHLSLATLRALPNATEAIARRGVAWTFDGAGIVALVRKLRNAAGRETVLAPTFDHAIKDPVEGGLTIDKDVEICIIEGNYLLCEEEPWREIAELVDDRWLVSVDPQLARKRVAARHLAAGIETTMDAALKRTDENDLVNGHATSGERKSIRAPNPSIEDSVFRQLRLDGRTVIITGGAGGIGYEIARGLAEAGANLSIWYHSSQVADKLASKIAADFGVKTKTYKVDVTQYSEVEAAVNQTVQDFGRLDVMIANAGVPSKAGGLDDKVEDWNRVRAVDFDGAYYSVRAAGLVFRQQKRGVAIITASMSGHAANVPQEQSCYNAAKAGCIHLAKSLSVEWAKWGGRINSVSPGYIDTSISGDCPFEMKEEWFSLTPLKRDADPRELKGVYLYLASDASSYTTGADFVVDGGYTAR
ncbi:hypothetical protein GGR53DRAFT_520942 [Hypoxylon sp. FL1150]|nr:hypothetical protein GGR53DRAFT_520942 [Hypoxylon sp. FL1150]